ALAESNRRLPRSSRWNPQRLDIAPQHAHAERMKSRDDGLSDGKAANQLVDPFNHLRGSFVGERHCQNGLRHHPQMLDQMGNAASNDARLPAAGAARMSTGPSVVSTASRCCGLSWERKDNDGNGSRVADCILQETILLFSGACCRRLQVRHLRLPCSDLTQIVVTAI